MSGFSCMALEHCLLWTPMELPSLACHFQCLWELKWLRMGRCTCGGQGEEQRTCLVLDVLAYPLSMGKRQAQKGARN